MTAHTRVLNKRPRRNVDAFRPGLSLGRANLPWAVVIISQTAASMPARDDRGRDSACARAVGASTRRSAGTSITARTPNACGWSGAGRQPSGRPSVARTMASKPNRPSHSRRAVSVPSLRHNRRRSLKLRRRVVTQRKLFFRLLSAIGRGAMNRPPSWVATKPSIAVPPAVRRFTGCLIVSVNG
jgi:hypothetical protein